MNTRASNSNKHPGLVDVSPPSVKIRASGQGKKKVAAGKRAEKAAKLQNTVGKLADMEKDMATADALDETPRAVTASRKLRRQESTEVPPTPDGSDVEMSEPGDEYQAGRTTVEEHVSSENEGSEEEAPQKKKVKKSAVRDSIKEYNVKQRERAKDLETGYQTGDTDMDMNDNEPVS